MSKYVGMVIRKTLQCRLCSTLLALWGFYRYMSFHFLNIFPATCFGCFLGERRIWTVVQMVSSDVVL